ncbi:uncharacterized protein LOC132753923 isoform X2 [Ruditapes philippinarum]|uniref:uncharacterized protein LOC132753923 isoform X1 n=1 Tax=Ruditapes philippinarum TaxID=129788 RepID=UPI00295B272A|nr:uncharacterized protein LOC132753923 isoform X1 [Ruditapes philippinarum]XP_060600460.1 uncharacterized protein LOC132753923 isoform X1 [Ruditapes philippinarum]XP_060600461.1 uncharacterized protein LOC132753923 isoform X1 [Ruditapes philippinarum]XP_060600462.1 uncharacterized protein LOC132753923 isoform X2 [Ruditapes philippinarum]
MNEEVLTHKPSRSLSKYVNEAFSFLNVEDVDEPNDKDTPVYISKELQTVVEGKVSETVNGNIHEIDHHRNGDPEEFRIETTVVDEETTVNGETVGVNGQIYNHDKVNGDGGEFSIVTFVENDHGEKRGVKGENFGKIKRGLIEINPVYEVNDDLIADNEVVGVNDGSQGNTEETSSENQTSKLDKDAGNSNDDVSTGENGTSITKEGINTERLSVVIDDEVVELRKSPDVVRSRQSRQPTWRKNQHVVSEAFNFLTDIDTQDLDTVTDSVLINGFSVKTCSECGQNLTHDDKISVEDQGQLLCKHCESKHTEKGEVTKIKAESGKVNGLDSEAGEVNGVNGETDDVGELPDSKPGITRKRRLVPQNNTDNDDGNSSDEDKGVYRESFRKSTWLYIGDNEEIKERTNHSNFISLSDLGVDTCDTDSIFGDNVPSMSPLPDFGHIRNDSVGTTMSEQEFRNQYNSVARRFVKRADSQQEYKRFTTRGYDNLKSFTIERDSSMEFGIHILDSKPAIISGIDAGSAAESSGLKEGQIVVSINGVNVLEASHDEIINLVTRDSKTLTLEVGTGDTSTTQDLQVPVMTGYLQKQVSSTIFRTWKRRYFILRRDNCLYYYKNEKETDPLGAIPLNCYTVSRHGDLNKFGFKAEKYNSKTFYFMAESREQMTNWVGAMNDAASKGKSKDSWMDVTAHNVGLPALNIRSPDCSGYLFKMGRATRRWRKRYCVLKDACIYYYKNANSKEADGVAHLHGYTVEVSGVSGKKFSFSLRPPETQMRTFSFYTDNDTDKMRWVQSLNTSIKKWVKVD